jgi:hypothetical protein
VLFVFLVVSSLDVSTTRGTKDTKTLEGEFDQVASAALLVSFVILVVSSSLSFNHKEHKGHDEEGMLQSAEVRPGTVGE